MAPGLPPDREGVKVFVSAFHAAFPDGHISIDQMIAEGDFVAVRTTFRGTHTGELMGIPPTNRHAVVPGSSGVYGVQEGIALGLDQGARGVAWGYNVARRRVVWTTPAVPWPHYFVDLSGIGGSADPASSTVLLTSCAKLGIAPASGSGQSCLRPELVAIRR